MLFNMDGIGGLPQTYPGKPFILDGYNLFQYTKTNDQNNPKTIGISNSAETLGVFHINDITYSITLNYPQSTSTNEENILINTFDQILSTFEFTSTTQPSSTEIQVSKPATTLSYSLPSDWQTTTDPTNTFQIGHDPQNLEQIQESNRLMFKSTIGAKSLQSIYQVTVYDGGSRHLYLQEQMGEPLNEGDKLPDFQEVEYLIQGKKCLVYDGYNISMSPQVWGMCPITSRQALFFNLARNDYLTYLKTIKFL